MEQDTSLSWPDITTPADDEFSNFLEFGMQFPDLEGQGPSDQNPPRSIAHSVSMPTSTAPSGQEQLVRMDTDAVAPQSSSYDRIMGDFPIELSNQVHQGQSHGSIPASFSHAPMTPAFYAQKPPHSQLFNHQQLQQPQEQPHHQHVHHVQSTSQPYVPHGQHVIPPTPNSIELQGSAATYPQRVDESQEMYDRYARINEEQALYTPLVSPAMTPLETQFRLPEYTIPGEYFTPLTSPALEAQNGNSAGYPFHSGHVGDIGFVHSPVDSSVPVSSPNSPGLIRKHHRRRPSNTKTFSARAKKQQSPSVRPQTRKKSLLHINSDEVLNGLSQHQGGPRSQPSTGSGLRYGSNESSGQDSVSPEPLSEPLMPPPALPPARRSPAIAPQTAQPQTNEPATPAMLMRIQRPQHSPATISQAPGPVSSESHDDIMEDVVLPEAATPTTHFSQPQVPRIDTSLPIFRADAASPATSASVTPAFESKSASLIERNLSSVVPSPRTVAMPSPSGPVGKKSDTPKLGPMSRKRQSLTSSQPSPNLRPKISPSIQPLVRGEAGISSETSALYLASKSNYQHILDGTLLPGVSYPETLAENLSSKRTNHKLAEQGRRNRINNALKEIEALIPAGFVNMKNVKDATPSNPRSSEKEKEKASNQQISKASTVEMAIDYIKALKKELEETKGKLQAAEVRLGETATSQTRDGDPISSEDEQLETSAEIKATSTSPEANGLA
ncbi:hypothetical protein BDV28DRAFT_84565 [Aspergillus coremiiformis]|uniref:BHLH domain-containing protein n=1 Tax=Aspergillus coremiiformis TaxID=138285 RepID=A0A5N6YUM7_9EURO|nr:hypothetical protein BDV28DRAFT_84565 [Aspergillus coremiiformis]